jgi:hypothetical protein
VLNAEKRHTFKTWDCQSLRIWSTKSKATLSSRQYVTLGHAAVNG